jgi:hypothetical protein
MAAIEDPVAASQARYRRYMENEFVDLPLSTVILNVYDITWANALLSPVGLGVHHTGVEVYGREYSYGRSTSGTGVFEVIPKKCAPHIFRESIVLGTTRMSQAEIQRLIVTLSGDWQGPKYHISRKNCNVFSAMLARELLSREGRGPTDEEHYLELSPPLMFDGLRGICGVLPIWVNRLAEASCKWAPAVGDWIDNLDRKSRSY